MASLATPLRVSKGYNQVVGQITFSSGGSRREDSISKIIQVVFRAGINILTHMYVCARINVFSHG